MHQFILSMLIVIGDPLREEQLQFLSGLVVLLCDAGSHLFLKLQVIIFLVHAEILDAIGLGVRDEATHCFRL
jgi:hypothetical protein